MANFAMLLAILPKRGLMPLLWPLAGILLLDLLLFGTLRGFFLVIQDPALASQTLPFSLVATGAFEAPERAIFLCGAVTLAVALLRGVAGFVMWRAALLRVAALQSGVAETLFKTYLALDYVSARSASFSEQKALLVHSIQITAQLLLPLTMLAIDGVVALAIVGVLLVWEPIPALVLLFWLVGLNLASSRYRVRRARDIGQNRWDAFQQTRHTIDHALYDVATIRVAGAEALLSGRFAASTRRHTEMTAREVAYAGIDRQFLEAGLVALILLVFAALLWEGNPPEALLTTLVLFAAASIRVFPFALRLATYGRRLAGSTPDLMALRDALGTAQKIALGGPLPAGDAPFASTLEMRDIDFSYPGGAAAPLRLERFELRKKDWVLIRGASGAGKTTFLSHLLGLIEPGGAGRTFLDGSAAPLLPAMRAANVAIVPQRPLVIQGSVAENIAFPQSADTLDRARAQEILDRLGLGLPLERPVGEEGKEVSGGQAQRLALARALYGRPALLVLDEATSHLDQATSDAAWEAIAELCPSVTLVAVSHKGVPEERFNRVIEIARGEVREFNG